MRYTYTIWAIIFGIGLSVPGAPLYSHTAIDTTQSAQTLRAINLGPKVNSKEADFGSYLLKDGLTMYFVSKRNSSNDQFWSVRRTSLDGAWGEPELIKSLNNDRAVGGITIDDSGTIYFATNYQSSGSNNVNIWEGVIDGKTLHLKMLPSPVNTTNWETQPSITGDGKNLYFAKNFPGFSHKIRIVVSHRLSDNVWSEPNDLGPQINLGDYNGTPFISPDGQFLFFSTSGKSSSHRKIYMSWRSGPKDTDWSEAIELPGAINSEDDNIFPLVAANGATIYFSSNRNGGYGGFDIYQTQLPPEIQAKIASSFKRK